MTQTSILMVEDERIIAFDLKQRLETLGYHVVALAASGAEAIDKAEAHHPDLVLMDIHLEGAMDGIDAARTIHKRFHTPVVFLTAYAGDEMLQRAQASLPFGYLVKPVETRELHATLQMALARRSAESAVERSEERLRLALDAAELGVWEWEAATGRVTTAGYIDALFASVPEPINMTMEDFLAKVHPDDRAAVDLAQREALERKTPLNLVFRYLRSDGSEGWMEAHAKPCTSAGSDSPILIGVVKDITERYRLEKRLHQASMVFETTAEGIFIMTAQHQICSVNPAFTVITGYAPEEALGKDPGELLHARRHSDQFYFRLENTTSGYWQDETYCRRKNGEVFPAFESVSVVRNAEGAVTHYAAIFSDLGTIRRAESQLNHLAHHDPLTGLPNRLLFSDRLDQALERAQRKQQCCALLFLDLDGFKIINDTLGHGSGDLLLQTVAARLKGTLRRSDTATRLGGDEFVVIIADVFQAEDVARLAQKLLDVLSAPLDLAGERVTISASMGISIYPADGEDRHALLKAADTAMYSAKTQGRNRYCFYTQEMATLAAEHMHIEQGLKRALETDGFELHYQPQISLVDGVITGIEALVRWRHPQDGLISPARFIPLAEETGLIEALGHWVLSAACSEVGRWLEDGGTPLRLSVNVSGRQLENDHFAKMVSTVLTDTGFPASLLEIEITESTLQILERSRRRLDEIKGLGLSIAIDDFGTGYSNMSVLKHLPIDRLKIDRSFVRDIPGDSNDVAIVKAIAAMSHTLGLKITAEGVEEEAQLLVLRRLGCEESQGFWFSRPLPFEQLKHLLRQERPWGQWN
jgi:diguanylate cyclase (GGDEF)-like protein/PAS domain S-box-containing protein